MALAAHYRYTMLTCKQTSELISAQYDRQLNFVERISMRFHLVICRYCSVVEKQIAIIQKLAGMADEITPASGTDERLPEDARARIINKLMSEKSPDILNGDNDED